MKRLSVASMFRYRRFNILKPLPCTQRHYVSTDLAPSVSEDKNLKAVKHKIKKQPFLKNIFLGIYDTDTFAFPEALSNEKLQHLEEFCSTIKSELENINANSEADLWEKRFDCFKKFGLFGKKLDNEFGGEQLTMTEVTKIGEIIGLDLSASLILEMHHSWILNSLLEYGTEAQKEKYVKKLLSGEWLGSYAMSEENSGSDPSSVLTEMQSTGTPDEWFLNGQKMWVTNAKNAEFFLVFAKSQIENRLPGEHELSVVIVDKNSEGVTVSSQPTLGLNSCDLCKVDFHNVKIYKENLLGEIGQGYDIAVRNLNSVKCIFPSAMSVKLKELLTLTTEILKSRKYSGMYLKETELVQKKLAKVMSAIYILDSMLYTTAGLIDQYENTDISLESAALQTFSCESGLKAVNDCLELLGAKGYSQSYPYEKLGRDFKGIALAIQTIDIHKLYISLIGIQFAGKYLRDSISKMRNPLNFPGFVFRKMLTTRRHSQGNPELNLKLYMHLHPTLKLAAEQLEYCVLRLQYAVEVLLARHGSEIVNRQLELIRISEAVIDIYAMGCGLARASRSYCTGIRHHDEEVILVRAYCQDAYQKVKVKLQDVIDGGVSSSDLAYLKIGNSIFKNKGYFLDHPLRRNIL